jgi:D-alanyl-D-alanine carboxypeptidase
MKKEEAVLLMEEHFRKKVQKDSRIGNAYLLAHSDRLGIHLNMAEGTTRGMPAHEQQPYVTASVTKLFTAVLTLILVEKGLLDYEDSIHQYLDHEIMHNLHIYKGKDYSNEIKVKHLLKHTSGLQDHFEDKPKQGQSLIDMIFKESDHLWTPLEVIQWSKEHLTPHFPPGKGFHYSDTGYHLLGLIIEKVTSKNLHDALSHNIFEPLGMNNTFLADPFELMEERGFTVADLFSGSTNMIHYRSLSINFAGGGIIGTTEDLLKFMKALTSHKLISKDTFMKMKDWSKYAIGIDYGYGLMQFKPVPLLMPKKYLSWGHAGATGSFMFYHPELDLHLIGSLNQFRYHRKGIMLMFKMIDITHIFSSCNK